MSALHLAALRGHADCCATLLEHFAYVEIEVYPYNTENDPTVQVLHCGVLSGNAAICRMLLENQADPNSTVGINSAAGEIAPLHVAASNGSVDVVNLLTSSGAAVNARDRLNASPLHYAVLNNHAKAAEKLLQVHNPLLSMTPSLYTATRCDCRLGGRRWRWPTASGRRSSLQTGLATTSASLRRE
jgi:ankyrin repeat protein